MSSAIAQQFQGWPWTRVKNGIAHVVITGRNPIGKAFCKFFQRKLHGCLFLWVLWMLYKMGQVNEKYLIDLAMMVGFISLGFYLIWSFAISYEAEIIFTKDLLKIKPAHCLFFRKFSRRVPFGWDHRPHHKARLIDPAGEPNIHILFLNHKDQFLKIATFQTQEKCLIALSRLQNISKDMDTTQANGLNSDGKENDPFAGRPGF